MKKILTLVLTTLLLLSLAAVASAATSTETGTGVVVIKANDWANTYADVYASYMKNAENEAIIDHVEEYPMIATVYEGMAFNKFYGSARGHYYTVQDVTNTGRPHALANCFTCKTPDFTAKVNNEGVSAYTIPFADMLCWWYKKANVEIYLTEQTMIDAMTGVIEAGLGHMSRERVRFHLMEEDFVYEDENIRLWLIPNCHLKNRSDTHDRPSYSIVLEAEGKRLIFTGDMSMGLRQDDFPRIAIEEPSDFILCEMAHFGAEPVEEYIKQCKTKQVWFNHVSFKQELFDAIEEMDKKYPFTVKAANDGDTVIL